MRIQHNIMAMNAYRNYNNNTNALSKNLEKLSSGYRINRAGDDAAGLAISEKMRAQITGLDAAQKNVQDGISLVKTAEGAMQEIQDMLNRMVYLATQSANGTYEDEVDRENLQKEVDALMDEINRISDSANFNGRKLLDGSLDADGTIGLTANGVDMVEHAFPGGITVGEAVDGGGAAGKYTISIDKLFGNGDTLDITFGAGSAYTSGDANIDTLKALSTNTGKLSLTFGTDFEGATVEEQAASIAEALNNNDNVAGQFTVTAEGSKIVIQNINEGNDQAIITAAATASGEVKAVLGTPATTSANAAAGATANKFTFNDLFDTTSGKEFEDGDVLTISVTDANGVEWTAEVTVKAGTNDAATHTNIINALNATGDDAVFFKANGKTAAAEETIKFSSLFAAATADSGKDLEITEKANGMFQGGTMKITSSNSTTGTITPVTATSGAAGTAATYEVKLATSSSDTNYSVGDKLKINGTLSDGRTFSVELVAGTDFEIGDTEADTNQNIVDALNKSKNTVEVKDADGNVENIALDKIFSATAGKNEIQATVGTNGLTFTSQVKSNANNGKVTGVTLTAADIGSASANLVNGVQQTAASSSLTFDSELEEGATATVNGTTYQFVTDAANVEEGNTAIVVADLTDTAAVATAFANQLTTDAGDTPAYTAAASGSTVTITTTDKGGSVEAIAIEGTNADHMDAEFQLQPNKIKTGSTITVNGQVFEFMDTENAGDALSSEDNIRVDVDLSAGDTVAINQALKDAIEGAGVVGVEEVRIAEDGTLTVCGDGEAEMSVVFENGKALTLQIGDTSDDYNQLEVSVRDMHTWALDIDDISISTLEEAQSAIDVIRTAINRVSSTRGDLGAIQNRLEHTANNLSVMEENIQNAESAIRDTDIADEMTAYTKNNILLQSAQAMLAQANQVPQGVLQLLQ